MKNMVMIFPFQVLRFSLGGHLIDQGPVKTEPCALITIKLSP